MPHLLRLHVGVFVVALASISIGGPLVSPTRAHACGSETYQTKGVIKSFGPSRQYVNIAHEDIPGYMRAMTMSFEAKGPEQLRGLEPGDRVALAFAATDDGRRILQHIAKEPPAGKSAAR